MKRLLSLLIIGSGVGWGLKPRTPCAQAQNPQPPVSTAPAAAPAATAAPPPSSPAKLGQAELEKLLMPIALYPDALIATMLPASVYPLEIVQAARFLADS